MKIKMQNAEVKKVMEGRTGFRSICRPRWKEYTLIKYVDRKEVSREKVWVDESKLFPFGGDSFGEPQKPRTNKKIA